MKKIEIFLVNPTNSSQLKDDIELLRRAYLNSQKFGVKIDLFQFRG